MSKLVPKLRFDGFSGEWEEKNLGSVVKFLDGKRKPIKESDRAKMQGEYPYYGASGIIDYVNNYIFDEDLILLGEDGENIVSRNLSLVFKISGKSWINNHAHVLKPNIPYNLDFLVHYMETLSYLKYNSGGAQPKLNQAVCKTIPLILPKDPKEQQKIASCLSSLDSLIEAQNKKVEALKKHKKGLMQQLFPKEGERVPALRFDGFSGEWEEKKLGEEKDITITIGEFVIKTKQHPNAKYPVYNGGKTYTGFYDEFNNNENKVVISARGANAGYVNIVKRKYWAGNSCYSVGLINENKLDFNFLYFYIKANENRFTDNQQAANIPSVSKKDIENFQIAYPQPKEQQKIASCLSSLDSLIEANEQKGQALKKHKKGLMQQMFVSEGK